MTTVFFDSDMTDDERRNHLYGGDLFTYSATQSSKDFCEFAREMICEAFDDSDPETAQSRIDVQEYVNTLAKLKPEFIHHAESKKFVRDVLRTLDCDLSDTYFDVPRMRSSTSDGYLTTGIAYAWHPHRDTWYSAPKAQINVWLPIFPIRSSNTVAFHPPYFGQNVANDSERYNYYQWNKKFRGAAVDQKGPDKRPLPGPTHEIDRSSEVRLVCPVGGLILFSGAQLHSSVQNLSGLTRFSIDFRVINVRDVLAGIGGPTIDVKCTGSNIRDFIMAEDFSRVGQDVVKLFNDGTEDSGDLTFQG